MAMKESGIEWVGLIPDDWKIPQVRNFFEINRGRVIAKTEINELYKEGLFPVYSSQTKDNGCMGYIDSYDFEKEGLTWTTDGAYAGTVFYRKGKYNCTNVCGILTLKDGFDASVPFCKYSIGWSAMNCRRADINGYKIMSNEMAAIKFVMPPLFEQQAIANYLDETCSKIDEIIAEAKASIDEYKELKQSVIDKAVLHGLCNGMMKDSGNDLIGKIPLSWEMRKLKYVADFNPGITTAYDAQKEVGYVPMNCVKNGYMNPLSARLSDMSTGLTGFQDGDIVIAKVTPCFENGNIAVAENLEQGVAFGSSELFVIRTHSINRRFMLYYLQNSVFKNQCISTMTGTGGLKRVSGYFVNNAYITYPPENEQQVIVNYLDEAVKNMDSLISEKESLINDLEAYKKSLIYEVVTGKRKVV